MKPTIAILGGGIAGLTAAIALQKAGLTPIVFEAAETLKPLGAGLVLASNAMKALDVLEISDAVTMRGTLLKSFIISDQKGRPLMIKNSKDIKAEYGLDNFAIHRADLHDVLLSRLKDNPVHTGKRAVSVTQNKNEIQIAFQDGKIHATDFLIVADGIHSPIRKSLIPSSIPRYAGYTCWRAVVDGTDFDLQEAYETWGLRGRFGYVPLSGNRLYWFACINAPQQSSSMEQFRVKDLFRHFNNFHSPIPDIISITKDQDLIWSDISDLKPLKQYAFGRIVLIGDAAHATTPNLGQGACMAIEDAVILANEMGKKGNYEEAFKSYEKRRLKRTHNIIKKSRTLGRIAHIENALFASMRNLLLRSMPSSLNDKQLKELYNIDF
ncbi:MAG TPA: FAD-dependent monooxygenase [Cyclobacteriaceae bacterium]|nr:FAD-dependent monooxygenase [Cyclobacteriaceae bacterium]